MKQVIFLSVAAAFTTAAIFLFRKGRKKSYPPIVTFNDLYYDNYWDTS